jgi:DNA polymerase III subunit delta'
VVGEAVGHAVGHAVGPDGLLPLPWLEATLRDTLQTRHAHALLLYGPRGVGQFELALTLAQAWLCEAPMPSSVAAAETNRAPRPCGQCASCRLVQARSHPDLLVLLPEALREPLGWNLSDADDAAAEKAAKAKPSKEVKVEAVRAAVAFAQITSARGRCKVVVVYPAERMNEVAANALLKTLEEPPGVARFVLACAEPDALLATIRSRCQAVPMRLPPTDVAVRWLAQRGVVEPAVLLAAAGGQPQEALEWVDQGVDAALWTRLPALVQRGEAAPFAAWPLPRVVDALQKLCHDAACVAAGAAPRYFPVAAVSPGADVLALTEWSGELRRAARHAEHPWNAALMIEALVQRGQRALAAPPRAPAGGPSAAPQVARRGDVRDGPDGPGGPGASVHSRA